MSRLEKYLYPISYVLATSRCWTDYGLSNEHFFTMADVDPDKLKQPESFLTGEEFRRINALGRKLNQSGRPSSLLVAEQLTFTNLGLLGLAVSSASDVRQILQLLERYHGLALPGLFLHMEETVDTVEIHYHVDPDFEDMVPFWNEVLVCGMKRFTHLLEEDVTPVGVYFTHTSAFPKTCFAEWLGCPVYYGSEHDRAENCLVIHRSDMAIKVRYCDPATHTLMEKQLETALATRHSPESWEQRVATLWELAMSEGRLLSQNEAAEALHVSPRTLARKLSGEGVSFRELVRKWRLAKARDLLERTRLPVGAIAEKVGFEDENAFYRFFRENAGITPRQYRVGSVKRASD